MYKVKQVIKNLILKKLKKYMLLLTRLNLPAIRTVKRLYLVPTLSVRNFLIFTTKKNFKLLFKSRFIKISSDTGIKCF